MDLNLDTINPNIRKMQYAVRGPIVLRALEIEKELKSGISKPFSSVTKANIGDAQAMGQQPMSFLRQVLSVCINPRFLDSENLPADVMSRASSLLKSLGGNSVGAYSNSWGVELIRKDVSNFISKRDGGISSNPENIVLCGGASEGIRSLLNLFNVVRDNLPTGVMVPIPQYPLYSASIVEFGMHQIGYYLDESQNWALDTEELSRALSAAASQCHARVIVVINPGNPTGQVLSRTNIESIIRFAYENRLFIFADEVYQENVYDPNCSFHSFKKVMKELGEPYSQMGLASFHSVSKGFTGECGLRGGYVEIENMDPDVFAQYRKSISAKLCPTIIGQVAVDCMVNPPKPFESSYDLYAKEKEARLKSLAERAKLVKDVLDKIDGISCNVVQGAMYAFPAIHLPQRAVEEAQRLNQSPDFFYCMQLLESTGICVVPGSGFGQKEGTYHFRTTILPQPDALKDMLEKLKEFHVNFLQSYA